MFYIVSGSWVTLGILGVTFRSINGPSLQDHSSGPVYPGGVICVGYLIGDKLLASSPAFSHGCQK